MNKDKEVRQGIDTQANRGDIKNDSQTQRPFFCFFICFIFDKCWYLLSQWHLGFNLLSKILLLVLRCNQFPFEVVASGALN